MHQGVFRQFCFYILHSAFCISFARVAQREVLAHGQSGLIPRIALDQCLVPERYRTRVPFRIPEREVDRAALPFHLIVDFERRRV